MAELRHTTRVKLVRTHTPVLSLELSEEEAKLLAGLAFRNTAYNSDIEKALRPLYQHFTALKVELPQFVTDRQHILQEVK